MAIEPSQLIDQDGSQNEPSGRHKAAARPPFAAGGGLSPGTVAGLPRFAWATFTGAYPFARLDLADPNVPLEVSLEAFNPFIPDETGQPWVGCPVEPGDERSEAPTPLT